MVTLDPVLMLPLALTRIPLPQAVLINPPFKVMLLPYRLMGPLTFNVLPTVTFAVLVDAPIVRPAKLVDVDKLVVESAEPKLLPTDNSFKLPEVLTLVLLAKLKTSALILTLDVLADTPKLLFAPMVSGLVILIVLPTTPEIVMQPELLAMLELPLMFSE